MGAYKTYPLIAEVEAHSGRRLLVRFRNGVTKLYDCKRILALPAFKALRSDDVLFRRARADKHGYGVIWNDELDLAESEVWVGGRVVREKAEAYESGEGKKVKAKHTRRAQPATGKKAPCRARVSL
jgi:hypothetical protein